MKQTKLIAFLLALATAVSTVPLGAAEHLVTPAELRQDLQAKEADRADQLRKVKAFFERESPRMERAGLDAQEVTAAVASLDGDALERLAQRVGAIDADVAAGALSNQELTYIVIALGTAVLILVIVAA